jgi:hypothetical protein
MITAESDARVRSCTELKDMQKKVRAKVRDLSASMCLVSQTREVVETLLSDMGARWKEEWSSSQSHSVAMQAVERRLSHIEGVMAADLAEKEKMSIQVKRNRSTRRRRSKSSHSSDFSEDVDSQCDDGSYSDYDYDNDDSDDVSDTQREGCRPVGRSSRRSVGRSVGRTSRSRRGSRLHTKPAHAHADVAMLEEVRNGLAMALQCAADEAQQR